MLASLWAVGRQQKGGWKVRVRLGDGEVLAGVRCWGQVGVLAGGRFWCAAGEEGRAEQGMLLVG